MPRLLVIAMLAATLALTACGGGDEPATAPAGAVTFQGVVVNNPADLGRAPQATSSATRTPTGLEYKDLVVGTGAAAVPTNTVKVQYEGLTHPVGNAFDSSWQRGAPADFPLASVVPGFSQGIGGADGVPAMKVGGRRILILPPALGYPGGTPDGAIPPNTAIVFVVDLVAVS